MKYLLDLPLFIPHSNQRSQIRYRFHCYMTHFFKFCFLELNIKDPKSCHVKVLESHLHYSRVTLPGEFSDAKCGIFQIWYDDYLKWNSSDYGNITETEIDPIKIWVPDIQAVNRYHKPCPVALYLHFASSWHPMESMG